MASANDIVNMAIAAVGGDLVDDYTDVDDTSAEAILARLFYSTVVKAVFEAVEWAFAIRTEEAAAVTAVSDDQVYTHRIDKASYVAAVVGVSLDGTFEDIVIWKATDGYIYTQAEDFVVKFVSNNIAEANWPNSFALLVASALARKIAFPLTKNGAVQKAMDTQFAIDLELAQDADKDQSPAEDTTLNPRILLAR